MTVGDHCGVKVPEINRFNTVGIDSALELRSPPTDPLLAVEFNLRHRRKRLTCWLIAPLLQRGAHVAIKHAWRIRFDNFDAGDGATGVNPQTRPYRSRVVIEAARKLRFNPRD